VTYITANGGQEDGRRPQRRHSSWAVRSLSGTGSGRTTATSRRDAAVERRTGGGIALRRRGTEADE
jgi:hypothetical protein